MKKLKLRFLIPPVLLLSLLLVVFAQQPKGNSVFPHRLGIEIGLTKAFTVTAGSTGHTVEAFFRVPARSGEAEPATFSAIKLASQMVEDKVEVTVSVLSGDTSVIKSCKDWELLKESRITSYTLSEGEEATVSQLSNLGANFKDGTLTFKAVPAPVRVPNEPGPGGGDCGCARCENLYCCPNAGSCLGCGTCGDVCCRAH
jgi:hypothetical protein